jgi:PII-like signaling protein
MKLPSEGKLLRIFIGESDKYEGKPLYEWLVIRAKEEGLAGATVLRGLMGFGANSRVHTSKILRLSHDLPMIIEIVDTPEKIAGFLSNIENVIKEGLVTLEKAEVQIYRSNDRGKKQEAVEQNRF